MTATQLTLADLAQLAEDCEAVRFAKYGALREDHWAMATFDSLGKTLMEISEHHGGGDRREPISQEWSLTFLYLLQLARAFLEDDDLAAALEGAPALLRGRLEVD